ncbi:AAA family ATPase, partial [Actinomycetospora sp. C-140]
MRLTHVRLKNFQCFGPEPTTLSFTDLTFLLGPNASGKTACLQALSRMFCVTPSMRKVRSSDFHAPVLGEQARSFYIEANFEFEETGTESPSPAVADHYDHMRLASTDGPPQVRFRLEAEVAEDDVSDSTLMYILEVDENDEPAKTLEVGRLDRNRIHVHYMPARRDPADHISYGPTTLLGRILRAASWEQERGAVQMFARDMNDAVVKNDSIRGIGDNLTAAWSRLHRGNFFASPTLSFLGSDLDSLLQQVSIGFGPAHGEESVDYDRLSDGQQSLLYLSLILSAHELNQKVVAGRYENVDVNKLRPPTFSMIVMEEPENSLSPHS